MSAIHIDNRLVHYEVVGRRGAPVIFLHSWLGSWRYWLPTMEHASERYRTFAIDFWGFGESDRRDGAFSIAEYVDLVICFMNQLGIARASLVGHGLGGMVALRTASQYPDRVSRLMIVSAPIQGSQIQNYVRPGALSRLFGRTAPSNIWTRLMRQLNVDYPQILNEIIEDTDSLSETVVQRVIESVVATDLREDLERLETPLLAVFGEKDAIVSSDQARFLHDDHASMQQVIKLPRSNHFPFLDQPNVFNRLLMDFQASNGTQVEIKTEWRRRVSQLEYI
ncbi:alpha/beta fold hydrolase [Roseiflexus castenholzii]|uniref:Alpha/beta hydrolase fold n=1 Tax=Roseiflexus castenholzii (strain DSM 13941 / HLO8) TaxID=383372 RepID=A7NHH6_ROSCS|nr:alpha/beta hydrolase [Roseiflexus castenholzii]ABU56923.1 alpha/beta hydrolase fold [Roseiflexus castenholzii DSM 13941]